MLGVLRFKVGHGWRGQEYKNDVYSVLFFIRYTMVSNRGKVSIYCKTGSRVFCETCELMEDLWEKRCPLFVINSQFAKYISADQLKYTIAQIGEYIFISRKMGNLYVAIQLGIHRFFVKLRKSRYTIFSHNMKIYRKLWTSPYHAKNQMGHYWWYLFHEFELFGNRGSPRFPVYPRFPVKNHVCIPVWVRSHAQITHKN